MSLKHTYIWITESFCCTPETNTTLLIDYTTIYNKNLKKKHSYSMKYTVKRMKRQPQT